ncbi:MAG: TIGR02099 family protein [Candidatus Accumulibacter sp.]|nr:TIGR02099 family protein [Accumulibacter sp.]
MSRYGNAAVVFMSNPGARKVLRVLGFVSLSAYFIFIALLLTLRYAVLPNIENFHGDIERLIGEKLGREIRIGGIETRWRGINPSLILKDIGIADEGKSPSLLLPRIEIVLSWLSLPAAGLKLDLLSIEGVRLVLRRDADGQLFVAGRAVGRDGGGNAKNGVADWIFAQRHIRIHNAALIWEDEQRRAPALEFKELNFALDNGWGNHSFGLTARLPKTVGAEIDLRGKFATKDIKRLTGRVFVDVSHIDLAGWRQWVDYPFDLRQGRGALRAWVDLSEGRLKTLTADLSLDDAGARLGNDVPALDLARLSGRVRLRRQSSGFALEGRGLELARASRTGKKPRQIDPLDFYIEWNPAAEGKTGGGRIDVKSVDIGALAGLSKYFPLDNRWHDYLRDYGVQGRFSELSARWESDVSRLRSYSLKTGFDGFGMSAVDQLPKVAGLSGVIDANERGGKVTLHSKQTTFESRGIFPEAAITLDQLDAEARWAMKDGALEVKLSRAEFSGPDAAGAAQGVYRYSGDGPGYIDMTGALTRADARAVWRYIPSAVSADVRYWLRDSLLAGGADEASLTLKGNLADFPFVDPEKGLFLVTVKARDVTLDYGKEWPKITGLFAGLRFEKAGMSIDVERGCIFGTNLEKTEVIIPDFDEAVPVLHVNGRVAGPTRDFLKFIESSPVAQKINHFSQDMRATGDGRLLLKLTIPLSEKQRDDSKIEGSYSFRNNAIFIDPDFPPIENVNGALRFSGNDLQIPGISGVFLGGPVKIKGGKQKEGNTLILFNGTVNVSQARSSGAYSAYSHWLSELSGSSAYKGEVRVDGNDADVTVSSPLTGLASTLPPPFGKKAEQRMPLYFERKRLAQTGKKSAASTSGPERKRLGRDQLSLMLGDILSLRVVGRKRNGDFFPEFGAVAIEQPLSMPDRKSRALSVSARQIDLDAWIKFFGKFPGRNAKKSTDDSLLPIPVIFRTPNLTLFGKDHGDVEATVSNRGTSWKIALNSRAANGSLLWETEGRDKLTLDMKHLTVSTREMSSASGAGENDFPPFAENFKTLPDMEISIEDFVLGNRRFGSLELQARNDEGFWKLERIQIKNPAAVFTGKAEWQMGGETSRTHLEFSIDSTSVGRLLRRFNYPDIVRGGSARLDGKLAWNGTPISLDYASLGGEMTLDARRGQFLKVDPGAGKLLGLLSLQSLYRRISLDFRDVFNEGFAFDAIAGKVEIKNGVMRTENLEIDGPSANAFIRGEADIKQETQQLDVKILPSIGSATALGIAAFANPVAGVATLLAHKMMQSPLDQMFSLDYHVTGTWSNPKVEKKQRAPVLEAEKADNPAEPAAP